jgi:DNA helicase II / ATP-dependent DNA helicase PcrA
MISIDAFLAAVTAPAILDKKLNAEQLDSVKHGLSPALMIVAGPGSGKTTVLVLRALRHVLVDGFQPDNVLITTFTRKAAAELRDRLIDWGTRLVEHFEAEATAKGNVAVVTWLGRIDINSFQTGTLDSFLQNWLRVIKPVGSPNRIMLEQFAAKFIFRRKIFRGVNAAQASGAWGTQGASNPLFDYLGQFTFDGRPPRTQGDAADKAFELNGRLVQDLVDASAWAAAGTTAGANGKSAEQIQHDLLTQYRDYLNQQLLVDFSTCAQVILEAARAGTLYPNASMPEIKALLVDEYQDTNPIQEAIYLELAKRSGAAFTVVGDDDQALYRFRGATVELFTNFVSRYQANVVAVAPKPVYLMRNYRSSPQIINFFNTFATHDAGFQAARVQGKPQVVVSKNDEGVPVLGLFRANADDLATDLAAVLESIFLGAGFQVPGTSILIERDGAAGAMGDALLLSSTVREYKDDDDRTARLPALLREKLEALDSGVFNPRGQDLRDIPDVRILLGLIAECVDPGANRELTMYISNKSKEYIQEWRATALIYVGTNPAPHAKSGSLASFVANWKARKAGNGKKWPDEWPVLDLIYKLITWLPRFQDDPEHQIYLEAITRCVAQGANYSAYNLDVLNHAAASPKAEHNERSVNSVFSDVLVPVAEREIDVDEDLLFALPRSRLNIMTIHQSKGLEFPVVIVDVGSDFKTNHHTQAFRRFPKKPSSQADMEDHLAVHTPIGAYRTARPALDRTFDDLVRLYYVAYSRPKHLLILVGTTNCMQYGSKIANVAMFWQRNGEWTWRADNPPLTKQTPAQPENHPLLLI